MAWLSLGEGCLVRIEDVVAIRSESEHSWTVEPYIDYIENSKARAAVLLRNGMILPAYVSPETLRNRLRAVGEPC